MSTSVGNLGQQYDHNRFGTIPMPDEELANDAPKKFKLVVGLGNPGKKYQNTRHNVGWMVVDRVAHKAQWKENNNAQAYCYKTEINGREVEFLKPTTFMNESGIAVAYAKKKHPKLGPTDIIVVHDDKDIPLGEIRVQTDRSAAGHNGVKSIIEHLGTQNFTRVRVGIASAASGATDAADFVLDKFNKEEKEKLTQGINKAVEATQKLIS